MALLQRSGRLATRLSCRSTGPVAARRTWQRAQHRAYSSEHGKKKSDLPWLIGAVGVTVPAVAWLLQPIPHEEHHGHEQGHDSHKKEEEAKEEGGEKESEESGGEGGGDDTKENSDSGSNSGQDTPDTSDDESSDESSEGKDESKDEEAKASAEKPETKGSDSDGPKKPGLTGAKHSSTSTTETDNSKSKKGEGTIETARLSGPVDPNRPAR